jgi:hypothetical protein
LAQGIASCVVTALTLLLFGCGGGGSGAASPPVASDPAHIPPQIAAIPDTGNSAYAYEVAVPLSIDAAPGDSLAISATVDDETVVQAVLDTPSRTLSLHPKAPGQTRVTVEVRDGDEVASASFTFTVQDVTKLVEVTSETPETEAIVLTNPGATAATFDLTHNGHLAFSSMDQILDTVRNLPDEINNEPLQRKIWRFVRDNTYHFPTVNFEQWMLATWPTLNSFGFGFCSNLDAVIVQIAQAAGFEAHVRQVVGHVTAEILVDGAWEMYDPDLQVYYYRTDGRVASVDDLIADPSLITSPINPIYRPGENDVVYSQDFAERYSSQMEYVVLSYLPDDTLLDKRLTLPAGARLIYPGVWTSAPITYDDFGTARPVEQFRQARLELPAGYLGSVSIPWVLWDVQGSGTVRMSGRDFIAGSAELRGFLHNPGNAITEIEAIDNPSGLALIMMINPLWYDMHAENYLELTGKDVWAIDAGTYPLDPENRPPPPVPVFALRPRD